jgi:hypothetical protein
MADNIGFDPIRKDLTLSWKADFLQEYEPQTSTYHEDTAARIEIYSDEDGTILATFDAELSPELDLLTFFEQDTAVNNIPDGSLYHMYQSYPRGAFTADFLRYYGEIQRKEAANGAL